METLRIAILTETLPPDSLKLQPWRYLGELARALQDAGHEASALTTEAGVPTWNGVRVDRHPDAIDFRSARRLHRLVETRGYDAGIVRLTAGLFFSLHREPGTPPSKGRLIGIFLRPLDNGWDLARRFLDPTLVPEIRLDLHHAGLYASRRLGTWADPPPYVNDYAFLWECAGATGISAGLPAGSCSGGRRPFDPLFLERRGGAPASLCSRSGSCGPRCPSSPSKRSRRLRPSSRRAFTRSDNSEGRRASSSRGPGILRTSRGRSNSRSTTPNGPRSCGKTTSRSERRRTGSPSQRTSCPSSGDRLSSGRGRGFLNAGPFQREAHVDGSLRTTSRGRCDLPVHRPRGGRPRTVCDPRGHDASESLSGRGGPRGLLRHGVLHARPRRGGTHPDVRRGDPRLHRRTDDPHHGVVGPRGFDRRHSDHGIRGRDRRIAARGHRVAIASPGG